MTGQEQAGYEFEAGRQRLLDQRRKQSRGVWGVLLLLLAIWAWFSYLSPRAQREAQNRREFDRRLDAIVEQANRQ